MKRSCQQSCFLVCILLSLILSPGAFADGKYFGETAYKIPPSIPSQRAILVYRDGTETLIIESALEAEGTQFGWIIPVPAQPTSFEKTSPGMLKTLSLAIQPKVVHEAGPWLGVFCVTLFVVGLWSLIIALRKPENPGKTLARILLYLFLPLILVVAVISQFTTAGVGLEAADIAVKDVQHVGSYDIAVLDANSPEALNRWLQSNGFVTLDEDESPVVADYISDGWYFVAAKLHREQGGYSEPHPVAIRFPVAKPIYPMRLTGFATDELYLEIFVVCEQTAKCEQLSLECSDTYDVKKDAVEVGRTRTPLPAFVGTEYEQTVGHPDASQLLWENCLINKLAGVLTPEQMGEDLVFKLEAPSPHREMYYTHAVALSNSLSVGMVVWSIVIFILTSQFYGRLKIRGGFLFYLTRLLCPVTLAAGLLALAMYAAMDKTEARPSPWRHHEMNSLRAFNYWAIDKHTDLADASADELREFLVERYSDPSFRNEYTGERIKEEDSPGNYTIFEDERGVVWRSYTSEGFPVDFVLAEEFE